MIDTLITHSGSFHADDLLAFAVLSTLHPQARLVRTRDPKIIADADAGAVIFDLGFRYAPEEHRYDHHQPDRPRRPDGLAYSSFGLVWRHFGRDYIAATLSPGEALTPETVEGVHAALDSGLVRDIDAVDNGELGPGQEALMHPLSLPSLLGLFRPPFDSDQPGRDDAAFLDAAATARLILEAQVRSMASFLRSRAIVRQAMGDRSHPNWIELPRSMEYLDTILSAGAEGEADRIEFVVLRSRDEWQLKTVNVSLDSFQSRRMLPAGWAGLRGPDLVAATGVPDAVFCHSGRFVAIARSRDGVMSLLSQALAA
jgi:uncharacterized UPF0160 family protein